MEKTMKAKVIAKTTVYGKCVEIGDVVDVDSITFRNLAAKGRLESVVPEIKSEIKPEATGKSGKK
jgi:hypothetical protein